MSAILSRVTLPFGSARSRARDASAALPGETSPDGAAPGGGAPCVGVASAAPRPTDRAQSVAYVSQFGGREVHWRHHLADRPPVVLMAGCGLSMEFWRDAVALMDDSHLVAYDRPGMGGTRWNGHLPTLEQEVGTLRELIEHLDAGPAILVAHSMAAFHAEATAREFPELVAGVVYVDASVEFPTRAPRRSLDAPARIVGHMAENAHIGRFGSLLWRRGSWAQSRRTYERFGQGHLPSIYRHADTLAMATAESLAYPQQAWDLVQQRDLHAYPDIPGVVLSASGGEARRHLDKQRDYARLLGAEQEVVPRSRHLMMLDRPEVIVDAVERVTDAAAERATGAITLSAGSTGAEPAA